MLIPQSIISFFLFFLLYIGYEKFNSSCVINCPHHNKVSFHFQVQQLSILGINKAKGKYLPTIKFSVIRRLKTTQTQA